MPIVKKYQWYIDKTGYPIANKKPTTVKLHRLIMNALPHQQVDHINGDRSDCRRSNLRLVSNQQNSCNTATQKKNRTGYKGVFRLKHGKYEASICFNRRRIFLGNYFTPEEAAIAYNEAALRYFGEYARINVIGQPYTTVSATMLDKEGGAS